MIFVFGGIFVFFVLLLLRNRAVVDIFTPGIMLMFLKFLVVVFVRRVLPEANALDVALYKVVRGGGPQRAGASVELTQPGRTRSGRPALRVSTVDDGAAVD